MLTKFAILLHRIKQLIREFFSLSKAEQYGIIVLSSLILLFTILYFLLPFMVSSNHYLDTAFIEKAKTFQRKQQEVADSIEIEKIQSSGQLSEELARQRLHPFIFDPNKLPTELWKKIGLTDKQISVIKNYEAKGGKFFFKEDFKKLYCISAAEYNVLEPYIHISAGFSPHQEGIIKNSRPKIFLKITEINRADTIKLKKNLALPYWLGKRVVNYRKKLGGFYKKSQLLEVYGMKRWYYDKIEAFIRVDTAAIQKICVNSAGFKQLLHHPYCNYKLTKQIFNARDKAGGTFSSRKELLKIIDNDTTGLKLLHYLYICPSDLRDN